jgi:hypothetical protein
LLLFSFEDENKLLIVWLFPFHTSNYLKLHLTIITIVIILSMHLISIGFLTILFITCGVVFGTESFTIENEKVISGDGWVVAIADIDSDLMQVV